MSAPRVTPSSLRGKKSRGQKTTMLTAYDFAMAAFIEQAGVDAARLSAAAMAAAITVGVARVLTDMKSS